MCSILLGLLIASSEKVMATPGEVKGIFFDNLHQIYREATVVPYANLSDEFLAIRITDSNGSHINFIRKKDFLVPMQ